MTDDRPPELIELLDHLAEVMPPLTPEEEAAAEAWREKMRKRMQAQP
jgi:hypothetical protein